MPYTLVRDLPDTLQTALKALSYNKRDIQVVVKERETLFYPGGKGYQCFSVLVNLGTGERVEKVGSWGGANAYCLDNHVDANDNYYPIPKDVAVIKGYRGGSSGITHCTITLSPMNVLPLLPAAPTELTEKELHILGCMRFYTSAYRKPLLDANVEVVNALVERGYIKRAKNGALSLTTTGKGAAENVKV